MALLKFKRSAVPAKVPALNDLALGELAINTYDGKVYTKKDNGTASIVEVGGGGGVTSFNTRTGAVTLSSGDVTTALGYTPANKAGDTFNGVVSIYSSNDAQLYLNGNGTSWAGMSWADVSGSDFIWYNGSTSTFAIGGGGSFVANKKLHVHGGMTIGSGLAMSASGTNSLLVENEISATIFRDSQDSAYYVDPAASSNLYSATVNSVLVLPAAAGTNSFFVGTGDGASLSTYNFGLSGWNGMAFYNPTVGGAFPNATTGFLAFRDGFIEMRGSLRAPVFYDSDNTGYYVDAAGTSVLGGIVVNSTLDVRDSNAQFWRSTNGAYQRVDTRTEATSLSRAHWYGVNSSGGTSNFRHAWYDNAAYFNVTAQDGEIIFERTAGETIVRSTGSFRAPIFYDSNNTAYYVDPASGTVLNRLVSITGAGNTNGGNLQLGDKDVNTAKWSVLTGAHYGGTSEPKGVMLIGSYSASGNNSLSIGGNVYEANPATYIAFYTATTGTHPTGGFNRLNINGSGNVTAEVDIRSPIYYDSNDTSYYVDPATAGLSLRVNGNIECYARSAAWSEGLRVRVPTRATWGGIRFTRDEGNANGNWAIGFTGIDSTDDLTFWGNLSGAEGMRARLTQTGIFSTTGELRTSGQITNSNYMVGGSQSGAVNIGRNDLNYRWEGTAWGSTTTLGLLANCLDYWEMGIHDSGSKVISPLYYDGGARFLMGRDIGWGQTYVEAASSFRAPVFYDSNDTNYYIDAASNSVLNTLTLGGRATTSVMYYQGFTLDANTMDTNATGFTYGVNAPFVGPIIRAGESGYSLQLNAPYGGGGRFAFRTRNGDTGSFNSWQYPALYDQNVNGGGALYASIYYDQNNTVYYLNPESTSVLWEAATYYLRNIEDVAVNHEYGLYFSNSRSTAYAIYREAGAWTHPFPDLRIAFHTGIKMGAAAGYGGMKFYTDYDMSSQVMSINNSADGLGAAHVFINNALQVNGDIRTPVFYDVNDTAYYLNPNSTGTSLNVAGSIVAAGNVTAYSDIRIKANVETIPSALEKVDLIRGVTYTRTDLDDKEQRYAGVIAQEIEAVLPEAVRDLGNIKAVDYNATIALLIEAVKELALKVKTLEEKDN